MPDEQSSLNSPPESNLTVIPQTVIPQNTPKTSPSPLKLFTYLLLGVIIIAIGAIFLIHTGTNTPATANATQTPQTTISQSILQGTLFVNTTNGVQVQDAQAQLLASNASISKNWKLTLYTTEQNPLIGNTSITDAVNYSISKNTSTTIFHLTKQTISSPLGQGSQYNYSGTYNGTKAVSCIGRIGQPSALCFENTTQNNSTKGILALLSYLYGPIGEDTNRFVSAPELHVFPAPYNASFSYHFINYTNYQGYSCALMSFKYGPTTGDSGSISANVTANGTTCLSTIFGLPIYTNATITARSSPTLSTVIKGTLSISSNTPISPVSTVTTILQSSTSTTTTPTISTSSIQPNITTYPQTIPIFTNSGYNSATQNTQNSPQDTTNLDNQYGYIYTSDVWISQYEEGAWEWDFGSSLPGTYNINWYSSAQPVSTYCISFTVTLSASPDGVNWTQFGYYTFSAAGNYGSQGSPIISSITGNYRYLKMDQQSSAGCMVSGYTYVDAVYKNSQTNQTVQNTTQSITSTYTTTTIKPTTIQTTIAPPPITITNFQESAFGATQNAYTNFTFNSNQTGFYYHELTNTSHNPYPPPYLSALSANVATPANYKSSNNSIYLSFNWKINSNYNPGEFAYINLAGFNSISGSEQALGSSYTLNWSGSNSLVWQNSQALLGNLELNNFSTIRINVLFAFPNPPNGNTSVWMNNFSIYT